METLKPRVAAIWALHAVVVERRSLRSALSEYEAVVEEGGRPLLRELCYGVVRFYFQLQHIVNRFLHKPLPKDNSDLGIVLLVGLYQMIHMRIPDHAVVMETVSVANDIDKAWAKGLINAMLRSFQRQRDQTLLAILEDAEANYSHPSWLIARLQSQWPDQFDEIIAANNEAPPMSLRVNSLRSSRDEYLAQLTNNDIDARASSLSSSAVCLSKPCDVSDLHGFHEGMASVQDESAQLAAGLLDLRPDQRVLDACAAPGGKTCHILEVEPKLEQLTSLDVDASRLDLVRSNLSRLGLDCSLVVGDASRPTEWWKGGQYDRILLDVPCSATGVIRRNPDIKLLRQDEDIAKLARQQQQLLEALWPLLATGGMLLYSTCSVLPEENWQVVQRFLERNADAAEKPIIADWGQACEVGRQLLPTRKGHDGFYYSRIEKA